MLAGRLRLLLSRHRRRCLRLCPLILLLSALMIVVFVFVPPAPEDLSLGRTDLRLSAWLSVSWSMTAPDAADLMELAERLSALRVDDVYVYVSYLLPDGSFNTTFDFAPAFVAALKRRAPDLRLLAWIGLPVTIDGFEPANRLASAEIRRTIADFSRSAVLEMGFDGVHLNAELVADGDGPLLETLAAIRDALPEGAFLSATAHPLRLHEPVTIVPYPAPAHHWTAAYFQDVARKVDQIVVMAYDSGLVFPRDYRNWMAYQVARSQEALSHESTELVIGASLSAEWTVSHQTQAETLELALAGMKRGMAERLDGIAIYPFWEMNQAQSQLIAGSLGR